LKQLKPAPQAPLVGVVLRPWNVNANEELKSIISHFFHSV
jgi:hypothetical protein